MTDIGPDPRYSPPALSHKEAWELASRHGLQRVGTRPRLGTYLKDVWQFRSLIWTMSKGDVIGQHRDNYLGLFWSVLNPILLGVAYYLVFGILLNLRQDVGNFVAFLTIGLFTFMFFATVLTSGAKSLLGKVGMMRSLAFPRVILPIVTVLSSFISNLPAFAILVLIAVVTGEPVTLSWLFFPLALVVVGVMGLGIAMIAARVVHAFRDVANLVPLVVRLLRYISGVFFSIETRVAAIDGAPAWVSPVMEYQPAAVALTLVRETLISEHPVQWTTWAVASGWAVLFLVGGFLVFWRAEGTYGRA